MTSVVYGSIDGRRAGTELASQLNANGEATMAIAHSRHMREEEVSYPGTLSFSYAILGGLLVSALCTGMCWLVLWPTLGIPLPFSAIGGFAFASGVLGCIGGAIAGTAETRPGVASMAMRTEAEARTLMTAEVPKLAVPETVAAFAAAGVREITVA